MYSIFTSYTCHHCSGTVPYKHMQNKSLKTQEIPSIMTCGLKIEHRLFNGDRVLMARENGILSPPKSTCVAFPSYPPTNGGSRQGGQVGNFIAQINILGDILVIWAIKFVNKMQRKPKFRVFRRYFPLCLCSKVRYWAM